MQIIKELNKPEPLKKGDTLGIFTPSWPGNVYLREKYLQGINQLQNLGFIIKEGELTKSLISEGYRAGTAQERANEFNQLYKDSAVKGLIATIGGYCSSSIIPYLDYDYIKLNPKIVCGYSDITAIHLALNSLGNLTTFYGAAVIPSFGELSKPSEYAIVSWETQVGLRAKKLPFEITPPADYSNEFIDARKDNWKTIVRSYRKNEGWKVLRKGFAKANILVYNLNTLCALAGTEVWPNFKNKILILEQMDMKLSQEERQLNQLKLNGIFDELAGLIFSKPENYTNENAPFSFEELLLETLPQETNYPVCSNFDCGHTIPTLTFPQNIILEMDALGNRLRLFQHSFGFKEIHS